MALTGEISLCPKCDNRLDLQTDGSTLTIDIAHQGERVSDAIEKLHREVSEARAGTAEHLRLVVGSGMIGQAAQSELVNLERRGGILSFGFDDGNKGAILVKLKPPGRRR